MISFRRPKKPVRPTRVVTMDPEAEDEDMDDLPQSLASSHAENNSNGSSHSSDKHKSTKSSREKEQKKVETESSLVKKQSTLLSFDEELEGDDGEVFKIKKSSVSRRLMKQRDREKKEAKHGSRNDRDKEQHQNLPFSKDSKIKIEHFTTEIQVKSGYTGLHKDSSSSYKQSDTLRILNGREAEAVNMESEDEEEEDNDVESGLKFRRPTGNAIQEAVRRVLERGQIPDANLIHEARKRKQMAREMGGSSAPDFVPVDSVNRYRKDASRLIREDENDNSGDEERLELSLATNAAKIDREKRREVFNAALEEERDRSSEDSDPEIGEWEKQQLRKGVSQTQMYNVAKEAYHQGFLDQPQEHMLMSQQTSSYSIFPFSTLSEPTPSTSNTTIASIEPGERQKEISIEDIINGTKKLTPESIVKQLADRLEKLKISRERNIGTLDRLKADLIVVEKELKEAKAAKPALSSRFELYQNLRGYVTDLVDCLRCKVPIIESLENRMIEVMGSRQNRLAERRRQDVRDQLEEVNSTIQILTGAAVTQPPPTIGEVKSRRAAEREGRRTRRRRVRELKNIRGHKEGLSSDDEEIEMEINAYKSQKETIINDTSLVFEDVNEDFSSVAGIIDKFEDWREGDFDSYKESYAYMCVPKCVAPYIRLHVLTWDPLSDGFEMAKFPWVKSLSCFGSSRSPVVAKLAVDPDLRLIPSVAEKVLVPWITRVVKAKWDPTSASQTRKLVNVTKQLVTEWYVGPNSKPMHTLMSAVLTKFQESVELDVYLPLFPANVLSNKCSPASVFASRQFWSAVKLLGGMSAWQGLLSDKLLQVLALDALLTRYIQLGIRTATDLGDSAERCAGVINVLPTAWLSRDGESEVPNGLQQLSRCLVAIVQNSDCTITVNRVAIPEIVNLLKKLGSTHEAHMIMKKYS